MVERETEAQPKKWPKVTQGYTTDPTQSHKPQVSSSLLSNHSEATPPDVALAWRAEGQTVAAGEDGLGAGIQEMPSCPTPCWVSRLSPSYHIRS
jgi:hypothetical protein